MPTIVLDQRLLEYKTRKLVQSSAATCKKLPLYYLTDGTAPTPSACRRSLQSATAKSTKPARQLGTRICTGNPRMRRRVGRSESFLLTGQGEIVGLISCVEYVAFIRLSNWGPGYGEQARRTPLYFWQPRLDGMGIPPTMCPQVSPNI